MSVADDFIAEAKRSATQTVEFLQCLAEEQEGLTRVEAIEQAQEVVRVLEVLEARMAARVKLQVKMQEPLKPEDVNYLLLKIEGDEYIPDTISVVPTKQYRFRGGLWWMRSDSKKYWVKCTEGHRIIAEAQVKQMSKESRDTANTK